MIVDLAIYFSGKKACLYASVARIFDREPGVNDWWRPDFRAHPADPVSRVACRPFWSQRHAAYLYL